MNTTLFKVSQYLKHLDKVQKELFLEFKKFSRKFDGEVESLEKFIHEYNKHDLTDQLPQNQVLINDLTLIVTKGIMSKGLFDYLSKEGLNQLHFSKIEQDINDILSKMEETINLEIFGTLEHITYLFSALTGLSKQIQVSQILGLETAIISKAIETATLAYQKYETIFM